MSEEIFNVVNERDEVVGQNTRREVHRLGLKHRAVHVLVFNAAGQVWFLWGSSSTALNFSTDKVALPALSGAQSISAPLSGLTGGTTYYFQPVAETVGGTSYGAIQSFTTN